jgi:hypothetical protein
MPSRVGNFSTNRERNEKRKRKKESMTTKRSKNS